MFPGPFLQPHMLFKQLRMEGFLVGRWDHKNEESLLQLISWMKEASKAGKSDASKSATSTYFSFPFF